MPKSGRGARAGHREHVAERTLRAMELRKAGASYAAISRVTGTSKQQAFRDCQRALAAILADRQTTAEEHVALELERLDSLLLFVWTAAKAGDIGAANVARRVCESRRKLLGLDAAQRVELAGRPGAPVVVEHQTVPTLSAMSDSDLFSRLELVRRSLLAAQRPPPPKPEPEPEPDPVAAYEAALAARAAKGNGNG